MAGGCGVDAAAREAQNTVRKSAAMKTRLNMESIDDLSRGLERLVILFEERAQLMLLRPDQAGLEHEELLKYVRVEACCSTERSYHFSPGGGRLLAQKNDDRPEEGHRTGDGPDKGRF